MCRFTGQLIAFTSSGRHDYQLCLWHPCMPLARSELLRLTLQLAQLRKWKQSHIFIPLTLESARGNLIHTAIYSSLAAQEAILAAEKHKSLRSFSTSPKEPVCKGQKVNNIKLYFFSWNVSKSRNRIDDCTIYVVNPPSFIIAMEQPLRNKSKLYFSDSFIFS